LNARLRIAHSKTRAIPDRGFHGRVHQLAQERTYLFTSLRQTVLGSGFPLKALETRDGITQETVAGDTTYTCQLRAFVEQIRGEMTFPTDGAEGVMNMRIIDAVYRAAGRPPRGT
jgi:predicted dehydrogenase